MFGSSAALIAVVGIVLMIVGARRQREARKYDFENRTSGGVVEHKSFEDAERHRTKFKSGAAIGQFGVILIIGGVLGWFAGF